MEFFLTSHETDDRPVYICGNFNKWDPKDAAFKMKEIDDQHFYLKVDDRLLPDIIDYKYTKGGWQNGELDENGKVSPNRRVKKTASISNDEVHIWRLNWGPFRKEYFPIVELIDDQFYIPQLDKTRKVWALLPFDYYRTKKKYPVLYLQDAQNLFNEGTYFGSWEIDEKLAILAEYGRGDIIVIAVEHGGEDRIKEYVFKNPKLTEGAEGKKYIRFITDTLKPYVDAKYRTLKDRENTGIGGSSLGALISIYGGLLYPEVYSKWLLFSPSLWVEPNNNYPLLSFEKAFKTKVYLYGGKKEGSEVVKRVHKFEKTLEKWEKQKYFDFQIKTVINKDGKHEEFFWSQEFPQAIEFLYFDSTEDPLSIIEKAYKSRKDEYDFD